MYTSGIRFSIKSQHGPFLREFQALKIRPYQSQHGPFLQAHLPIVASQKRFDATSAQ
jgi:hypothetical protein